MSVDITLLSIPPLGSTIRIQWVRMAIFYLHTRNYVANCK